MKKTVVLYGFLLALLIFLLKAIEYRYWVHDMSMEVYIGIVAVLFTAVGIWAGLQLTRKPKAAPPERGPANADDMAAPKLEVGGDAAASAISKREMEVLLLIARGYSNQEIADRLFVSLNTVKKHSSSLFQKLDVKRRTQAIEKARQMGLIIEKTDSTKV